MPCSILFLNNAKFSYAYVYNHMTYIFSTPAFWGMYTEHKKVMAY